MLHMHSYQEKDTLWKLFSSYLLCSRASLEKCPLQLLRHGLIVGSNRTLSAFSTGKATQGPKLEWLPSDRNSYLISNVGVHHSNTPLHCREVLSGPMRGPQTSPWSPMYTWPPWPHLADQDLCHSNNWQKAMVSNPWRNYTFNIL